MKETGLGHVESAPNVPVKDRKLIGLSVSEAEFFEFCQ